MRADGTVDEIKGPMGVQIGRNFDFDKRPKANATQVAGTHYKNMGVEPWDVIDTWPIEQRVGAYRAGILKYVMRMGAKDDMAQEIRKAGHYCQKLAEVLESMK